MKKIIKVKEGTEAFDALKDIFEAVAKKEIKKPKTAGDLVRLLGHWQKWHGEKNERLKK